MKTTEIQSRIEICSSIHVGIRPLERIDQNLSGKRAGATHSFGALLLRTFLS